MKIKVSKAVSMELKGSRGINKNKSDLIFWSGMGSESIGLIVNEKAKIYIRMDLYYQGCCE